ncbi:MAG: ATP synthase F1 subunit gamma [Lachnospiraceae bacterium]|nr:ATP synthase F1 subunit gamma [Lachnospiraceae bacterium]
MASMQDIKRRRNSVNSTMQITKAMKLVSTVKLQHAKQKAESTKPYFNMMYSTVCSILAKTSNITHPYLVENGNPKKMVITITSNKGLAGGYNNNVIKEMAAQGLKAEDCEIYAIGRKGYEALGRKGYHIFKNESDIINEPLYSDAINVSKEVLKQYVDGEVGEIYLAYTEFKNTVSQIPHVMKLLPIDVSALEAQAEDAAKTLMEYEPEAEEALNEIVPKYMTSLIFGGFIEAVASENGARMQAMDNATNNAEEMIADLSLKYNRARQNSITQELTEIVAGASAIE